MDEESKLAQAGSESAPLQFSYKGKTATLQSTADIAAWIAERKKKFPTQERIEEKKKAADEAKAARDAAREAARREKMNEKEKMNANGKAGEHKEKQKETRKPSDTNADPAMDAAMKAQRKADKIRRNLDREQKRFAKAEAEAEAARLKVAALQKQLGTGQSPQQNGSGNENGNDHVAELNAAPSEAAEAAEGSEPMTIDAADKPSEPEALADNAKPVPVEAEVVGAADQPGHDPMDISSDGSGQSDWTSSSGSDSDSDGDGDSDSGSGDSDSAPEQTSSRRQGPEKVPPPPREGKKQLCRHFARSGQCNRGEQCSFSHDVSERRKAKPEKKEKEKEKGRKGLLSAVSNLVLRRVPILAIAMAILQMVY